jgi:hypothetical protein
MGAGASVATQHDVSHLEVSFYAKEADAFGNVVKYVFSNKQSKEELVEGVRYIVSTIASRGIRTEPDGMQNVSVWFHNRYTGWLRPILQQSTDMFRMIPKGTLAHLVFTFSSSGMDQESKDAIVMLVMGIPAFTYDNPSASIKFV